MIRATIVLSLLAFGCFGQTAHVQTECQREYQSTTSVITLDTTATDGNHLVCGAGWDDTTIGVTSLSSDCSGSFTIRSGDPTNHSAENIRAAAWSAEVTSTQTCVITLTLDATSNNDVELCCSEFSGGDNSDLLEADDINSQNNPGLSSDAVTSTTITTTLDDSFLFGFTYATFGGYTVGTGFSNFTCGIAGCAESMVQSSSGSQAALFTATNEFQDTITLIMAFNPVGGGTAVLRRKPISFDD